MAGVLMPTPVCGKRSSSARQTLRRVESEFAVRCLFGMLAK
jgi:hypothetical protein